jgi:hypothetical protein
MNCKSNESLPCCPDEKRVTPLPIQNPPRLSEIRYRVGTFSNFKSSMLSAISRKPELSKLTTRSDDDFSIALVDAWAIIGDVLTFYQERIANEGFLRTAKERRSIMELASSLGYQLSSGVAANTFLAFSVEESGVIKETRIQEGTKAQSLPGPDQMPQVFETIEPITARPELNNLRPRLRKPQEVSEDNTNFIFEGTGLAIELGDGLLLITYISNDTVKPFFRIISKVTEDLVSNRTIVDVIASVQPFAEQRIRVGTGGVAANIADLRARPISGADDDRISRSRGRSSTYSGEPLKRAQKFSIASPDPRALRDLVSSIKDQSDLDSMAIEHGIDPDTVVSVINSDMTRSAGEATIDVPGPEVYIFRITAGAFGNRAPVNRIRLPDPNQPIDPNALVRIEDLPINQKGKVKEGGEAQYHDNDKKNLMYLDASYPSIIPWSWIVLRSEIQQNGILQQKYVVYQVSEIIEKSLSLPFFDMTATSTGLRVNAEGNQNHLEAFYFRGTTVYAQSEQLKLSQEDDDISPVMGSNSITLDKTVRGLVKGGPIVISGKITASDGGPSGLEATDVAVILDIKQDGPFTKLLFEKPIEKNYDKKTISLNANVAEATHGETKYEVLGSGDPSKQLQELVLKNRPLTYVSAPNAAGAESTLEVRVDKILWREVPNLYGARLDEHVYITRIGEDNRTHVIFGDGSKGGRPTVGVGNIEANYRIGTGSDGMVEQGQISILISRALGVKSVTNPTKPTGAQDLENLEKARQNAPLNVITMDRLVSFEDFTYFVRAFRGVGKAQAIWLWDGQMNIIHLTVAPSSGDPLEDTSSLRTNLIKSINISKDPTASFRVDSFIPRFFNVKARILIAEDRQQEDVLKSVASVLIKEFSFESRELGQPVTKSEVVALIQSVDGVIASDIDSLYLVNERDTSTALKEEQEQPKEEEEDLILPSSLAHLENGKILGAELLMINSNGISLSMMQS